MPRQIMVRYRIQEADLQIPDGWTDQTLNIFKVPGSGSTKEASVIVSRDAQAAGRLLLDYVSEQLGKARQRLPAFSLSKQFETVIDGQSFVAIDYSWEQDNRPLSIRQLFAKRPGAVLILTLTCSPEDLDHHLSDFDSLCRSLTLQPGAAN